MGSMAAHSLSIICYTFYNLLYAFASFPMGYLEDIFNKKSILMLGYLMVAISYVCFALHPSTIFSIASLFGLIGCATAIIDGGERAIAAELLPNQFRGTGFGFLSLLKGIGGFASSTIVGFLWTTISATYGFLYAAVICCVASLILFVVNITQQDTL